MAIVREVFVIIKGCIFSPVAHIFLSIPLRSLENVYLRVICEILVFADLVVDCL